MVFGGDTLTTTDVAVAAGVADIGDASRVKDLDSALVQAAMDRIQQMAESAVDRMKTSAAPLPVIVVGGGCILIAKPIAGASEMVKPQHYEAANAVGAAIAQISGEVDRVYALAALSRDDALADAKAEATEQGGRRRRRPGHGADRRRGGRAARLPPRQCHPHPGQGGRRPHLDAGPRPLSRLAGVIMRKISADALDDIARGAAVLGTGGGGDPYIGKLMAQGTLRRRGPVDLLDPLTLADDDLVVPTAMMGAPTVMVEKIPRGEEIVNAFKALETYLGRPVRATMSCEAGGLNSTTPFTVAAELGIPLVDADMMGRAFPELQMCTPSLAGVTATPMAIADEKGNSAIINTIDNRWTETLARTLTIDMGCSAMIAIFPMTGKQVKETCVLHTLSLLEQIGRTIREARRRHVDPVAAVTQATQGYLIWRGKIGDVERRTVTGFARGEATIAGVDEFDGRSLEVAFQNEFLVARAGDDVLATTPDLITMLDDETGEPITTEGLRYGFRVSVLSIPCDPRWRTPEGLKLVGPGYFGYDIPYVPIEERVQQRVA